MTSAIVLLSLLAQAAEPPALPREAETLDVWLDKNEPRVISYLLALGDPDLGSKLSGVELTDSSRELEGYRFVEKRSGLKPGQHAWRFGREADGKQQEIWYLWVEKASEPLPWPECAGEWQFPGGAYGLSGDISIEGAVHPGMLVYTVCNLGRSIEDLPPNTSLKRTTGLRPVAAQLMIR